MKCCITLRFPEKFFLYFLFYIFFKMLYNETILPFNDFTPIENKVVLFFTFYTPYFLILFYFLKIKYLEKDKIVL